MCFLSYQVRDSEVCYNIFESWNSNQYFKIITIMFIFKDLVLTNWTRLFLHNLNFNYLFFLFQVNAYGKLLKIIV